jgi:hypothetical protein
MRTLMELDEAAFLSDTPPVPQADSAISAPDMWGSLQANKALPAPTENIGINPCPSQAPQNTDSHQRTGCKDDDILKMPEIEHLCQFSFCM